MPIDRGSLIDLVADELFPKHYKEKDRLDHIDHWYRWKQDKIPLPRSATPELKALADMCRAPWLHLVVSSVSQCLYVDGYRSPNDPERIDSEDVGPWKTWRANGMGRRQVAIHRAALAYGYSFVKVLPGEDHEGKRSVLRGVSPRQAFAVYESPAEDDWPIYVIHVTARAKDGYNIRVYDDENVYYLEMDSSTSKPKYIKTEMHGAGVCPFVRYTNMLDLDGRADGEVEPFIPLAARINKTSYDRMLTQHFNSWKIRTVAGLAQPDTEEEKNREKMQLRQDDLLVADDPDTKFGTLDETPLEGFVTAWRSDIEALAAVSQTPTHMLTGQLINLSAEALAAARAALTQKVAERQKSFGDSHAQALRLAARLEGNEADAQDTLARVTWQDMEIRSMSQAVDALGKAAQMLQVPLPALWQRIPGVEKSDVDEWLAMAGELDPVMRLTNELARQAPTPPAAA